jgi:hypothetical protein
MKTLRDYINLIETAQQGVAEGSKQKPSITYKDYTFQYDYQTEDDDPEGYSTATTYYFDVLKDGKLVGEAEYFDYFGDLTIRINGKTTKYEHRHPLVSQISELVSSLPEEQKKDLSDPRFESQGVAEGEGGNYYSIALQMYPHLKQFDRATVITALNNAYEDYLMHYGYEGIGPDEERSMIDRAIKGLKMLGKVHKRAVDRVTSKQADTDPKYAKKNQDTANASWERLKDKD